MMAFLSRFGAFCFLFTTMRYIPLGQVSDPSTLVMAFLTATCWQTANWFDRRDV